MEETIIPPRTVLHGDKTNGVELSYSETEFGEFLDEVVVYVDGKCVMHLESMSDTCYWMGIYVAGYSGAVNIFSKNNRSHIEANAEVDKDEPPPTSAAPTSFRALPNESATS